MLDVYMASAGSGKTYTLAKIFINLIIEDSTKYGRILAVTFTNKSTAEMKQRIVENLHILAHKNLNEKEEKEYQKLLDAQNEYRAERQLSVKSETEINAACDNALKLLLNNYGQFNILTIDKFVQKIIRSFAFENGLSADYKVNLETDQTKMEMVDRLMEKMEEDADLQVWLSELMNQNMDDGKGWGIEKQLVPIAESLLNGHELEESNDSTDSVQKRKELKQLKEKNDKLLKEAYEELATAIERLADSARNYSSDSDYKGKSANAVLKLVHGGNNYTAKEIEKIVKGTSKVALKSFEGYLKKSYDEAGSILTSGDDSEIVSRYVELKRVWAEKYPLIRTLKLLGSRFYSTGIITELKSILAQLEREQHMQMISEANELLRQLIDGASIPFIYEKAGTKFDHVMIDEFQDTSKTQWENFKPLIDNCIDQAGENGENQCLVVGDVKQAIYRWRNSDWNTLHGIVQEGDTLRQKINSLKENWRSSKHVIDFNNMLFPAIAEKSVGYAASLLDENETVRKSLSAISEIYKAGKQDVPPADKKKARDGYVQLSLLETGKEEDGYLSAEEVEANRNEELAGIIEELVKERGYEYGDICIIVRKNKEATPIVRDLNRRGIKVVSSQALYICEAQAVELVLAVLSLVVDSNNDAALAQVMAFNDVVTPVDKLYIKWNKEEKNAVLAKVGILRGKGLLSMVLEAIDMLPNDIVRRDYVFLEAFLEKVKSYSDSQIASVVGFLRYVEEHRYSSNFVIQSTEGQKDAVGITTVHKSKGLQFPVVLIPSADWEFFRRGGNEIWCDFADDDPYTNLKKMELPFSQLKETKYESQYYSEAIQTVVDNINLLYVAFTRAEDCLYVWCKRTSGEKKSFTMVAMSDLIEKGLNSEFKGEYGEVVIDVEEKRKVTYKYGDSSKIQAGKKSAPVQETERSESKEELIKLYSDISKRLSLTVADPEDEDESKGGTIRHSIMQDVVKRSDIDKAIKRAEYKGELTSDEAREMRQKIDTGFVGENGALVESWFAEDNRVINESTVIYKTKGHEGQDGLLIERRPDRVVVTRDGRTMVIDYKFGNNKTAEHKRQVKGYMYYLGLAGYNNVKGYLWYVELGEIEEVV